MKSLFLIVFAALISTAETYEFKVDGMTCSSCKKIIKSSICALPGLKSCDVEIGEMKLTTEAGQVLDQTTIDTVLAELNTKYKKEYKIISSTKLSEAAVKVKK